VEHENDDDIEHQPPEAIRVARRSLVFSALSYRGDLDDRHDAPQLRARLLAWLDATQLTAELEADEARFLNAPAGKLRRREKVNVSWRADGLAVLAWALGMMEMPPHDEQCPAPPIAEAFGFLQSAPPILAAPRLRSSDELASYGEQVFAIHWRIRQYSLDHEPMDFVSFARTAYFGPLEIEGLPMMNGDLAIRGLPIAQSPDWEEVHSITRERHQAANWLLGHAPLYSDVGTDT
jgi:hypothetical protein